MKSALETFRNFAHSLLPHAESPCIWAYCRLWKLLLWRHLLMWYFLVVLEWEKHFSRKCLLTTQRTNALWRISWCSSGARWHHGRCLPTQCAHFWRMYSRFPFTPYSITHRGSPIIYITHQKGTLFLNREEPILTHHGQSPWFTQGLLLILYNLWVWTNL